MDYGIKIGIMGGTFDPIHYGHLRVAEEAGEALNLDRVYLIPVNIPPHKSRSDLTPFRYRYEMIRLAVQSSKLLDVSDIEGKRGGISYTVDTLRQIKKEWQETQIYFIIGIDAFLDIKTWKDYKRLFSLCNFVVIRRAQDISEDKLFGFLKEIDKDIIKKDNNNYILSTGLKVIFLKTTLMDISSTRIRELASQGKTLTFLLPDSVIEYILKEGLYRFNGYTKKGASLS